MNPAPSENSTFYQVYLLKSQRKEIFYIGYTNDIKRRLREHNSGLIGFTKKYAPWNLVYFEAFLSLEDAKKREKSLKNFGKAYTQLKFRIKGSLDQIGALNNKEGAG
jgi:putative endonuclease